MAGPQVVAFVFKFLALLTLAGAAISIAVLVRNHSASGVEITGLVIGAAASAAAFAFFAYVLELLLDIRSNTDGDD